MLVIERELSCIASNMSLHFSSESSCKNSESSSKPMYYIVLPLAENKQILDYLVKGATHDQIRKWIGHSERNYWKRIAAIRKRPGTNEGGADA